MMSRHTKIFVQLAPDTQTVRTIHDMQHQLKAAGCTRLVAAETLHMTVVHIGKAQRMIDSMRQYTTVPDETILQNLEILGSELESITSQFPQKHFTLPATGFAHFGDKHDTLVMRFASSEELDRLHTQSLEQLKDFFRQCKITDADSFMHQDANFKHALTVRPHVTIAKSCTELPTMPILHKSAFQIMPIFY